MTKRALSILFVEDHHSTNETLTKMLRRNGHEVFSAGSAQVALTLMSQHRRFDLLVSDIGLPDCNGWDLLKQLRAMQPNLRAIALTGYGFANDVKRSGEIGFEFHLTKPISWPAVEKTISSMFPEMAAEKT